MRLAFLGSGAFGLPTLERLAAEHEVVAVVSQPDRPAGRGKTLTPTPIAEWTSRHLPDVHLMTPEKIAAPDAQRLVTDLAGPGAVDAWVVIAFGQKIPSSLLAGMPAINLHASLLPRWRGAAPINAAILAGDTHTGNSVITLADRMDAGLVLGQSTPRPIRDTDTAGDLHDALAAEGPACVEPVLAAIAAGTLAARPQDEALVTLAPKLSRADAVIDFSRPGDECRRRINGLSPWPGVTVLLNSQPLKLLRAAASTERAPSGTPPGAIIGADAKGRGLIACGDGSVFTLIEVQPAGKRLMLWRDFLNGGALRNGADHVLVAHGGSP